MNKIEYEHHKRRIWAHGREAEAHLYRFHSAGMWIIVFSFDSTRPGLYAVTCLGLETVHPITREEFEGHSAESANRWRAKYIRERIEQQRRSREYTVAAFEEEIARIDKYIAELTAEVGVIDDSHPTL